jgi:hypothetical protein
MDATPQTPMTRADYDTLLLHAARETVKLSRKLLDQTNPLVTETVGGGWIGARIFNPYEDDPSEDMKQHSDG